MLLLAVETSCDETSVAVLRDGCVLANAVSSQVKLHEEYGGVVPELASREHLRNLMPVARQAFGQANVTPQQLDAVAATRGPALPGAEELVAEAVPEKCLGYPDYKKKRGTHFFKKSGKKAAQVFYEANGYWKIAVKGSRTVFKFFKEVKSA